jgi:hypothetical protein
MLKTDKPLRAGKLSFKVFAKKFGDLLKEPCNPVNLFYQMI